MNDFKFNSIVWACACVLIVCAVIFGTSHCIVSEDQQVTDMVRAGANPIDAKCGIGDNTGTMCAIAASRAGLKNPALPSDPTFQSRPTFNNSLTDPNPKSWVDNHGVLHTQPAQQPPSPTNEH